MHDDAPVPPAQRLVFKPMVEGLLTHALQGRMTPRLRERLHRAGVDVDRPLLPAYSVPVWSACLSIIAQEVYPHLPPEEAHRRMAEDHVAGFGRTLAGRALFGVLRVLGPRRTLRRMTENLRSSDNFTRVRVEELSANESLLHFDTQVPERGYGEAVIAGFLHVAGARNVTVERLREGPDTMVLRVRWDE